MSFNDKKRDRELQIELLKLQLKYERENAFFSTLMGVGVSLVVFAIAFNFTVANVPELPQELKQAIFNFMYAFLGVGGFLTLFSIIAFWIRRVSEQNELHAIQEKFVKDDW